MSPGISKGQIEEKKIFPWVGLEPTKYFRAEIEKYLVRFLVQVKTVELAFEINWRLVTILITLDWNWWWHYWVFHVAKLMNSRDQENRFQ